MEELQDQLVVCAECGAQFTFTAKEQAFYKERGFVAPRRCRACRDKRKSQTGIPPASSSRPAGGSSGGPPHGAGPGGVSARDYFKIVCAGCGVETTVPFKPDPNRPAFCRKCYAARRKGGPGGMPG